MSDQEAKDKVKKVCKVLEVFNVATNLNPVVDYPKSNLYIIVVYIQKQVKDNALLNNIFIQEMLIKKCNILTEEMLIRTKEKFEKHWGWSSLLMIVPSVMDPTIKKKAVEYCYLKFYLAEESKAYPQNV